MILILTKSINRCFEKNPKFDMTPLLGGTDVVFSSLIHSFSWFVLCSLFSWLLLQVLKNRYMSLLLMVGVLFLLLALLILWESLNC